MAFGCIDLPLCMSGPNKIWGQNKIASPLPCQQVLKGLNAFSQITLLDVMMIFWTNAMVPVKFVIGEVVDSTNAMWNLKLKCTVNIINWTRWWI